MKLQRKELMAIQGGTSISASLINAISDGLEFIYGLGQTVGSAIARAFRKPYCWARIFSLSFLTVGLFWILGIMGL